MSESNQKSNQKTILLGVTGSVAAYKACELVRTLQKSGHRVKVVMTQYGSEFVSPAIFKALTNEPVAIKLADDPGAPVHHISLAREADIFCIAPCTANVLNKLANGVAGDLLATTALATTAPLLVAPAMNVDMWRNPVTQESITRLEERGVRVIQPEAGYLACGEEGEGRLAPVEQIVAAIAEELARPSDLAGRRVMVTAGPTREFLDPVRFISSPSSGMTGFAIAAEAARRGAEVTLITGPVALANPPGVQVLRVTTASEMLVACQTPFALADAAVFSAAVSDFRPAACAEQKTKKGDAVLQVELVHNPDILATLAANKNDTFTIGFAAETSDVLANACAKLAAKNADLIVANDVSLPDIGFSSTQNKVWFVSGPKKTDVEETGVISKRELARLIVDRIVVALGRLPR
ncbi:MAG: bifunctional phosphopantothenoylcysteine decarboxylase/phosphopantothenate--cysteine ligase CoaBC [Coriobacteriales bacterium]|jgi:phosphopantothenoylcysteine decarboxylase/phosphopantothenate--cysteine ligase|nr:bifunctional phosphopantothenoylcysteine decarboxylase/phosphopantothenate--cysteine ligase CoaBC [Coriobacteriales bacterium]